MDYFLILFVISFGYATKAEENLLETTESPYKPKDVECEDYKISDTEGVVSSPLYPSIDLNKRFCNWHKKAPVGETITIRFDDLDVEESCCCYTHPCCIHNFVSIGPFENDTVKSFCGKINPGRLKIVSETNELSLKYHYFGMREGGRGFRFHYKIGVTPMGCKNGEFQCANGKCIPPKKRCNGFSDCEDNSDEHYCSNRCTSGLSCRAHFQCYDVGQLCDGIADCDDLTDESNCGFCDPNHVRCGMNSTQCYDPVLQRCDGTFDCLNGVDEVDCYLSCPGKVTCNSKRGCYLAKHRCDGITQCEDASDELNCVPELCSEKHKGFLCDNGRCIQKVWVCDHADDCGDGSDEKSCLLVGLRNSVLTAAIMGSLVCGLLLTIAVSCTCKLHALRRLEQRLAASVPRETPLSRMSRDFMYREPPPSYAVAVRGDPRLCVENSHYDVPCCSRGRTRGRSHRSRGPPPSIPVNDASTNTHLQSDTELLDETVVVPNVATVLNQQPQASRKDEGTITDFEELRNVATLDKEGSSKGSQNDVTSPASVELLPPAETVVTVSGNSTGGSQGSESEDYFYCDSGTEPLVVEV